MSDAAQTSQTQDAVSQQQPLTPPPSADRNFRFEATDGVPAEFVGMSPKELFERTMAYKQIAEQAITQTQAPQQAPLSYQQPMTPQLPSADLWYSDAAAAQQQMANYNAYQTQAALQQAAQPLIGSMVEMARFAAQQEDKSLWQRWGHEIDREVSSLPAHMRNKQAFDLAAQIVKGRHVDELANERAQQIAANSGFNTERSGSVGGAPVGGGGDALGELLADAEHPWTRKAKESGMTRKDVEDYCRSTGRKVEDYVKSIRDGNVLSGAA